jgi:4-methyl-5(b-hydroxyethyl)-thiazole monophosphate biosynthesis
MVTVFLAEGFEEIEAVTPVDILRRGGVSVRTCSITDDRCVMGAHGVLFTADTTISQLEGEEEVILLPGGMPGTLNLKNSAVLCDRILSHASRGGLLAAICAAPTVFGALGLLKDKEATCYPGMEGELNCKAAQNKPVVVSGKVITSRGPGTSALFGAKVLECLKGKETAQRIFSAMCFEGDLN